jgi:hypothetical protein
MQVCGKTRTHAKGKPSGRRVRLHVLLVRELTEDGSRVAEFVRTRPRKIASWYVAVTPELPNYGY